MSSYTYKMAIVTIDSVASLHPIFKPLSIVDATRQKYSHVSDVSLYPIFILSAIFLPHFQPVFMLRVRLNFCLANFSFRVSFCRIEHLDTQAYRYC